ncbi:MAG: RsmB/NOP family class I SAM-dependent RNA methyltransferase [Candidatus Heimdallarchaeaceae archaeon]|jgi:16S rRNA (cytosine967-C5)-methyltransferase
MNSLIPIVITTLSQIEKGKSIRVELRKAISEHNLNREQESTLYSFTFEIFRKLNVIDLYIKKSSSSFSIKKISSKNRALFRIATYLLKVDNKQLKYVKENLESHYENIQDLGFGEILKLIQEIKEEELYENRIDLASKLSIEFFTPTWIVRKFINQWNENFATELVSTFIQNLPIYVRVNPFKSNIEEITTNFRSKNLAFETVKEIDGLIKITENETPIPQFDEFKDGKIVIQQKASALASLVLNPQEGEKILDMCASPGGKTSHLAALLGDGKHIEAVEINEERMKILKERLKLLGITSVKTTQADARTLHNQTGKKYDKILLDPPCSGSGTYSSRPEIKWRVKQRDLRWYINLQQDLFNEASNLVNKGGTIVYSTCSLYREENHEILSSFLERNSNFSLEEATPMLGLPSQLLQNKAQELYPHIHETEGFFIAKVKRNS